jgi:hypothetical protein
MAFEYDNYFVAVSTCSAASINVEVNNGDIVDSNGNSVHFGTQPSGFDSRGEQDLYVTQVKNASPTGNLLVRNDEPYVDGYGTVTLTDPGEERTVNTVGGNSGEDGDVKVDGGNDVYIEYDEQQSDSRTNNAGSSNVFGATSYSTTIPTLNAGENFSSIECSVQTQDDDFNEDGDTADVSWDFSFTSGSDSSSIIPSGSYSESRSVTDAQYLGDSVSGSMNVKNASGIDIQHSDNLTATANYTETVTKTTTISLF